MDQAAATLTLTILAVALCTSSGLYVKGKNEYSGTSVSNDKPIAESGPTDTGYANGGYGSGHGTANGYATDNLPQESSSILGDTQPMAKDINLIDSSPSYSYPQQTIENEEYLEKPAKKKKFITISAEYPNWFEESGFKSKLMKVKKAYLSIFDYPNLEQFVTPLTNGFAALAQIFPGAMNNYFTGLADPYSQFPNPSPKWVFSPSEKIIKYIRPKPWNQDASTNGYGVNSQGHYGGDANDISISNVNELGDNNNYENSHYNNENSPSSEIQENGSVDNAGSYSDDIINENQEAASIVNNVKDEHYYGDSGDYENGLNLNEGNYNSLNGDNLVSSDTYINSNSLHDDNSAVNERYPSSSGYSSNFGTVESHTVVENNNAHSNENKEKETALDSDTLSISNQNSGPHYSSSSNMVEEGAPTNNINYAQTPENNMEDSNYDIRNSNSYNIINDGNTISDNHPRTSVSHTDYNNEVQPNQHEIDLVNTNYHDNYFPDSQTIDVVNTNNLQKLSDVGNTDVDLGLNYNDIENHEEIHEDGQEHSQSYPGDSSITNVPLQEDFQNVDDINTNVLSSGSLTYPYDQTSLHDSEGSHIIDNSNIMEEKEQCTSHGSAVNDVDPSIISPHTHSSDVTMNVPTNDNLNQVSSDSDVEPELNENYIFSLPPSLVDSSPNSVSNQNLEQNYRNDEVIYNINEGPSQDLNMHNEGGSDISHNHDYSLLNTDNSEGTNGPVVGTSVIGCNGNKNTLEDLPVITAVSHPDLEFASPVSYSPENEDITNTNLLTNNDHNQDDIPDTLLNDPHDPYVQPSIINQHSSDSDKEGDGYINSNSNYLDGISPGDDSKDVFRKPIGDVSNNQLESVYETEGDKNDKYVGGGNDDVDITNDNFFDQPSSTGYSSNAPKLDSYSMKPNPYISDLNNVGTKPYEPDTVSSYYGIGIAEKTVSSDVSSLYSDASRLKDISAGGVNIENSNSGSSNAMESSSDTKLAAYHAPHHITNSNSLGQYLAGSSSNIDSPQSIYTNDNGYVGQYSDSVATHLQSNTNNVHSHNNDNLGQYSGVGSASYNTGTHSHENGYLGQYAGNGNTHLVSNSNIAPSHNNGHLGQYSDIGSDSYNTGTHSHGNNVYSGQYSENSNTPPQILNSNNLETNSNGPLGTYSGSSDTPLDSSNSNTLHDNKLKRTDQSASHRGAEEGYGSDINSVNKSSQHHSENHIKEPNGYLSFFNSFKNNFQLQQELNAQAQGLNPGEGSITNVNAEDANSADHKGSFPTNAASSGDLAYSAVGDGVAVATAVDTK